MDNLDDLELLSKDELIDLLLDIRFVSEGGFNVDLERADTEGYTRWSLGDDGKLRANHFPELSNLAEQLIDDAMHPA